ncbi:MAG TPA: alpha-amylase/4-alpha-glucanotransferase domain-containing protein [Syntrophorhabdaceae bacterium]|nr:alpha-amylase/4-alpha-glucanotransferase domain-containing protein [Syntrophorhabdaceae bacterium]
MDYIIEEAYMRAYMPFFDVLKSFLGIKINLHFSGYLFSWLQKHKPDYIELIRELARKGQIEIVCGGMYEPVLALLPEQDGISQIVMHKDLMKRVFSEEPMGMWLAERVYEPQIPRILHKAGIAYTLVDDNHFKSVGFSDEDLYGYYVTEYEGHPLSIFPGLETLRYTIPFKPLSTLDEYLKGVAGEGGDLVVFGDDGEKFGLWPGTYDSVYGEGWLESFFEYLTANRSWLTTTTFGEYAVKHPPKGRVYLECSSYKEMGEWSLPAKLARDYGELLHKTDIPYGDFLKGGYYKNFLIKYDESNDMHKKMLRLSDKAQKHDEARRHIFMAQANDSYWHGVFGGLYLPHLRASVYGHLIEAEKLLDPGKPFVSGYIEDVNMDGHDEAVLVNDIVEATFLLKEGGVLYGLDYKPCSANVTATLRRRYEGYHEKIREAVSPSVADGTKTIHDLIIAKEEGLDEYLHYDWYGRACLIDHVMGQDATLEAFYQSSYYEPGDFVVEPYQGTVKKSKKAVELLLERAGHFRKGGVCHELTIKKQVLLSEGQSELQVTYLIEGNVRERFLMGIEFNFAFLGSGGDRYLKTDEGRYPLTVREILPASKRVTCHDPYQKIDVSLAWDLPEAIWTFPVEVVSLSEQGFERNYQSTMIMPVWTIDLPRGKSEIHIRLDLNEAHGV